MAKATTTSKGKAESKRARKAAAAVNKCCPVIKWACKEKKQLLPKKDWDTKWDYSGPKDEDPKEVKVKTFGNVTKCTIKFGGAKPNKNLSVAEKDKKVEEYKKRLTERRCLAVEGSI